MRRDIRCQEVVELVTSYLEGVLPGAQAAEVEEHLHTCPGCVAYLAQMRTTIAVAGTISAGDVPEEVMDRLLAAFRVGAGEAWPPTALGGIEAENEPVVGPW